LSAGIWGRGAQINVQSGDSVTADNTSKITGTYSVSIHEAGTFGGVYILTPQFTANAEVFLNARLRLNSPLGTNWGTGNGGHLIEFLNGTSLADYLTMDQNAILRLVRGDGTVLATATQGLSAAQANLTYLFQLRLLVNATTGVFEVKIDGASFALASGVNTVANGVATIDTIKFIVGPTNAITIYLDDALVNVNDASGAEDGYAQDIRIARAGPGSAGHVTGLTAVGGTNLANVQPVPPSDSATNYNDTSTAATYDSYAPGTEEPVVPTGSTIVAVSVDAEVLTQNAPQNGKVHVYTHATDYASAALALPTSYGRIANRWLLNPNTGVAWTLADALAAEMGVGLA